MNLSLSRSFPIAKAALAAAVIACVVALTCSWAGCASGGTGSSRADADNTSASTDGKTLRVAMGLAYPPFETKDDAGNPEGLAGDFIRDFGAAYGYDVQIENTAWDGLIPVSYTHLDVYKRQPYSFRHSRQSVGTTCPLASA